MTQPQVVGTFKLSTDRHFEQKFWDVIGLYLHPPDRALVLCCDEKSQCQAPERSQPSSSMVRGYRRTQTHEYKRHGTVTHSQMRDTTLAYTARHTRPQKARISCARWCRRFWLGLSSRSL